MEFDIIATVEIETIRYEYILRNGKRDIDENNSIKEILVFKFNSDALEQILFRIGDPVLHVDDKEMYFRYKDNKLVAIHFENKKNIWIATSYKKFMEECKEIYAKLKMLEILSKVDIAPQSISRIPNKILDEFELPNGVKIKESGFSIEEDELDGDIIMCPECKEMINTANLVENNLCPYCYADIYSESEEDYFHN